MAISTESHRDENQLVSFKLGSEEYGIDIIKVQEIIKVPEITRVPRAPEYVEGVVNLRGNVLPIIDTRKRFGMEATEKKDSTRIIVTDISGMTVGMVVDSVSEVLRIEGKDVEAPPAIISHSRADYMEGIGKMNGGNRLISLLNLEKVLESDYEIEELTQLTRRDNSEKENSQRKLDDETQFVSFNLGSEEYAVDIEVVEEIIRIPNITVIPDVPEYMMGVISLRGKVIPVLSLRKRFHMEEKDLDDRSRILVIRTNLNEDESGELTTFGIIVDMVNEVLSVPTKSIEPTPDILSDGHSHHLKGVGKLNNGERLLLILNAANVFDHINGQIISERAKDKMDEYAENREGDGMMDEQQLVIFRIAAEEFGINIMNVQEIIRMTDITEIPGSPYFVEGVVNLRGSVLPVIDLRKRFELADKDKTDSNRIVVVNHKGSATGIIVDAVSEVLQISGGQIEPPPPVVSGINANYIEGIGKMDKGKRFIIILDISSILNLCESKKEDFQGESEAEDEVGEVSASKPSRKPRGTKKVTEPDKKSKSK